MRQIKHAVREGDISRAQYDQYKTDIRARRTAELDRAKSDLNAGRLKKKCRISGLILSGGIDASNRMIALLEKKMGSKETVRP